MENENKKPGMIAINLDEYYKDPLIESFIYVSMGMDNLKDYDLESYNRIKEKQAALVHETKDIIRDIRHACDILGLPRLEVDGYIEQFLQKFPLGLSQSVAWDDRNFVFLYIIVKFLKPKVIIETGCNMGFSSTFIALAVKENNNGCMFYTMDIGGVFEPWEDFTFVKSRKQKINFEKLKNMPPPQVLSLVPQDLREHIVLLNGSSKDILPGLLKENKEVDIFFHDSEHSYRNIIWESLSAIPYIKKGGYLLVHDVVLNSAFKDMFHDAAIVLGDKLGIFKKPT
jgi:predicted O-methyltransferase YrrM